MATKRKPGRQKPPTLSEIARWLNLSPQTVDNYAKAGLLSFKVVKGRRRFNKQRNERELARIERWKKAGYSMADIRRMAGRQS